MTPPSSPELDQACSQIVDACRLLASKGLVIGSAGNVSVRVGNHVAVTATGARFEDVTAEQISVVTLEGQALGELAATSEIELHLGVYRTFGSGAVVHTHAPVSTSVGLVVAELPCIHYQMLSLGGDIRVAPYETFGTPELAQAVVAALDGRAAALMANHGSVAHAGDLKTAVEHALLLEWACTVYWRAASMGTPRALNSKQQDAVVEAVIARNYGGIQR